MRLRVQFGRGAKGFTLLELLIVLALIGIASGFAVASVDKLAMKMEEKKWQDRTRHALIALRNRASRSGVIVTALVVVDPAEIRQLDGGESVVLLKLPVGFKYELVTPLVTSKADLKQKAEIYFFADGAMDGPTFNLVSPQGRRYEFKLTKHTGQVRGRLSDMVL